MQKILQYLMDLKAEDFPKDAHEMSKIAIPYVEVDLDDTWEKILGALLSASLSCYWTVMKRRC